MVDSNLVHPILSQHSDAKVKGLWWKKIERNISKSMTKVNMRTPNVRHIILNTTCVPGLLECRANGSPNNAYGCCLEILKQKLLLLSLHPFETRRPVDRGKKIRKYVASTMLAATAALWVVNDNNGSAPSTKTQNSCQCGSYVLREMG